jgi:membrane-associated phospholipid phosphatase
MNPVGVVVSNYSAAQRKDESRGNITNSHLNLLLLTIAFCSLTTGCGTLENGRRWGQDAIWPINFGRISQAASNAFFDPQTLIPLAGALAFGIEDFDEKASDWAIEHNPIYGSENNARDYSDKLKTVLGVIAVGTALATPSGNEPDQWAYSKLKGAGVELAAVGITGGITNMLKNSTDRRRPDESSDNSFPSAHASSSFSYMTLANRNIDSMDMPGALKPPLKVGNMVLAYGVAWARVEGHRHYPSDVLAGAALGHFLTAFIHDAFLNLPDQSRVDFTIFPVGDGAGVELAFRF